MVWRPEDGCLCQGVCGKLRVLNLCDGRQGGVVDVDLGYS